MTEIGPHIIYSSMSLFFLLTESSNWLYYMEIQELQKTKQVCKDQNFTHQRSCSVSCQIRPQHHINKRFHIT